MQRLPRLVVLVALIAAAACGSKQNAQPECDSDSICGDGQVCMMGKCLARGDDRTVAIEVVPKTDSVSARTSFPSVALSSEVIQLRADARSAVVATIAGAPDAHVVLTTPASIPGQADLRLEADLTGFEFRLGIPKSILGKQAILWLAPTSKFPQVPPARFATMLNETVGLAFPTAAEMTPIRAVLVDSLGVPKAGYVARARVLDRLVSSTDTTKAQGEVQLLIAPGAVPVTDTSNVTIEFEPPFEGTPLGPRPTGPRFVTWPFAPSSTSSSGTTPVYRLPAFATPAPLRFKVEGMGRNPQENADIAIKFSTDLLDSKDGQGVYEIEARTDGLGEVAVPLIPGTATEARKYRITILPPPNSPFASRCVAEQLITIVGNNGQVQYSATYLLAERATLTGTVWGADMKAASGVNVKATFIPQNTVCADVSSTPSVSASTDANGVYMMALDPGTYRLDIEPPSGAPWPRHTEDGDRAVTVASEKNVHDIVLPPGVVVVGHVLGDDLASLDSASVSIFEVLCKEDTCTGGSRVPPVLRSQTTTNAKGEFRAVLPVLAD